MSISSNFANITNAIAALSVSGVTIKDVDEITANWQSTANVLYPNPENFLTNFRPVYVSFTRGSLAKVDLQYTLNYRFLSTQVGNLGNFSSAYSALVTKVLLIIAGIMETTAPYDGKVDMELGPVTLGPRSDPAGNMYHGADIAVNISEMQNT